MKTTIAMITKVLKNIENNKLWAVIGGAGTGSVISLQIGKKIKRDKEVSNPHLSKEARLYKGEFGILISCAWRLTSPDKIICSWKDPNVKNGPMLKGLKKIINKKITKIEFIKPALDLNIHFDNSYQLYVFCDEPNEENDGDDDYCLFVEKEIYAVGPKGKISKEIRKK